MVLDIFKGVFDSEQASVIEVKDFLLCVFCSLLIGVILSLSYMFKSKYTRSFVITLSLLPAVVCVVIMMVNGNIGTGVAVAGAFSLVRFRSIPGTAKEIGMLFIAMSAGLITGMGYLAYGVLFVIILCIVYIFYNFISVKAKGNNIAYKSFRITIPESLNYSDVFDELFDEYTKSYELVQVKSTNMGSMFRLTYDVVLKDVKIEKELIDKIRERNGNLEILVSKQGNYEQSL